jgi:membrane dipeptidase
MAPSRRNFLAGGAAAAVLAALPQSAAAQTKLSRAAQQVYARATVIDGLSYLTAFDPADAPGSLLPRFVSELRSSGITAINFTVGSVGNAPSAFEDSVGTLAYWNGIVSRSPDLLMKVERHEDLARAKQSGRLGVIFGFQDSTMFGTDLGNVEVFRDLGVRIVQPTYNLRNLAGDGCLEPANGGLSKHGHDLVAALNKAGMLVDMSHAGSRTQMDGIKASSKPVVVSHSGCRALADTPRNTTDEVIRALASKGGVLGIYFMPFLKIGSQPHAEDVWRHLEHAINVAGEDHVGLGTDGGVPAITNMDAYRKHLQESHERRTKAGFAAPGESADVMLIVPEYNSPRRFELLADDLLRRGHSSARVEKILGGNFARVFRDAWS